MIDKHGTQIQATLFNKAVDKFDPILVQDNVYWFCKGTVKVANQKFTSIKNNYWLTFSPFSEITPTSDDSQISKTAFDFSTLKELEKIGEGKSLDVIGIVVSNSEVNSFNLKNGGSKDKRDIVLIDNSEDGGVKVCVTLWGVSAKYVFQPGSVVAFKGLRVTNYKGITLNGGDNTQVFDGSKLESKLTHPLLSWYKDVKNNLDSLKSLTITEEGEKRSVNSNVRLIGEINSYSERDIALNPQARYYINAHVEMIRNDPKMIYMAWPSWKKRMNAEDSGSTSWRCERWDMVSSSPIPTYILSVKLSDSSGSLWVKIYGDNATPIMGKMTADKFKQYLDISDESREQEIKDVIGELKFKYFSILIKPSISDYNGQTTISYMGTKTNEFSNKKCNDFLIKRLLTYQTKFDNSMNY